MKLLKAAVIALSLILSPLSFSEALNPQTELVQLSPAECKQMATVVAVEAYKIQGGKIEKAPEASKLAERVAKFIISQNSEALKAMGPGDVFENLMEGCYGEEGKIILPLEL